MIPTQAMLEAARDWSYKKFGKPIGNDAATGCWQAMLKALEGTPVTVVLDNWGNNHYNGGFVSIDTQPEPIDFP